VAPYSTFNDVRSIVDTDVTDPEITNIITWVDAVIDMRLDVATLTAPYLELVSATYAAYRCMLKDPNARSLGEYSENRADALKYLKDEVDFLIAVADSGLGITVVATRSEMV